MEILIVRHGDPDYSIDSLTEKGWKEAELLSHKLSKMDITAFYCSPLGRAKDTAGPTLKKMNREAKIVPWLEEIDDDCRDFLPSYWTRVEEYYSKEDWYKSEWMKTTDAKKVCDFVAAELDKLLAEYGYVHEGNLFRVERENHDRIVFFCHYGISGAILSHLTGISPVLYWQHFVAAPTSITTIVTEEREQGIATFRMTAYGDTGHLYVAGEEPAFAARFCECYSDDTRHN